MVLRIAHRGAADYALENSMDSFKKAVELEIEAIEFDVHFTKDKKIVIMHDDNLDRTTNGTGKIKDLTLKEIKNLVGLDGKPIPTFQEVIDVLKGKSICKVDIKAEGMENAVIEMIKKNKLEHSTIITSNIIPAVKKVKQMCPEIKIEMGGFDEKPHIGNIIKAEDIVKVSKEVNADIAGVHYNLITKELVEEIHKNNIEIHVWPADNIESIKKMKEVGVDGITSRCPDKI